MNERLLIVCDGEAWLVRHVVATVERMELGEMHYHCDEHLAGPLEFSEAVAFVMRRLEESPGE